MGVSANGSSFRSEDDDDDVAADSEVGEPGQPAALL